MTHDLTSLQTQLKTYQQRRFEEHGKRRNVENQHASLTRDLQQSIQTLHKLESDQARERMEGTASEEDCQRRVDDQNERLAYEKLINEALKKHLENMENSHKAREADWHQLADSWKDYEAKAIGENKRLLAERAQLQNKTAPMTFDEPHLPDSEPKDRPEAHFDASFQKPEFKVHKRPVDAATFTPQSGQQPAYQHHYSGQGKEEHLDPQDQHRAQGGHDTRKADHHAGHQQLVDPPQERYHKSWTDSHGVLHHSWEDSHGILHDSWQDAHGVQHNNWMDSQGVEHNEWADAKGVQHDDWLDAHGVHHDTWKGQPRHEEHHWQGHAQQQPQQQQHGGGGAQAMHGAQVAHGAQAVHGGGHGAVPMWHSGSHEHGAHEAMHTQDEHGQPQWRNPHQ